MKGKRFGKNLDGSKVESECPVEVVGGSQMLGVGFAEVLPCLADLEGARSLIGQTRVEDGHPTSRSTNHLQSRLWRKGERKRKETSQQVTASTYGQYTLFWMTKFNKCPRIKVS